MLPAVVVLLNNESIASGIRSGEIGSWYDYYGIDSQIPLVIRSIWTVVSKSLQCWCLYRYTIYLVRKALFWMISIMPQKSVDDGHRISRLIIVCWASLKSGDSCLTVSRFWGRNLRSLWVPDVWLVNGVANWWVSQSLEDKGQLCLIRRGERALKQAKVLCDGIRAGGERDRSTLRAGAAARVLVTTQILLWDSDSLITLLVNVLYCRLPRPVKPVLSITLAGLLGRRARTGRGGRRGNTQKQWMYTKLTSVTTTGIWAWWSGRMRVWYCIIGCLCYTTTSVERGKWVIWR